MARSQATRKQLGAWYTPPGIVGIVVDRVVDRLLGLANAAGDDPSRQRLRVLDPACGDGRFLSAFADRWPGPVELIGCDIDADALASITDTRITTVCADALARSGRDELPFDPPFDPPFDVVIGNPPFLSQMATLTSRGGSSRHGGGPYADTAAEFLALAVRSVTACGGQVALVLPQSILASRDAAPVRADVADRAQLVWSWWERDQRHFDASVNVCVLGFETPSAGAGATVAWTRVVTDPLGVPPLDATRLLTAGTVGDRTDLNANFRDEYYALVPAVSDSADGPPFVTSGLIDPGRCHWGDRPVRFARRQFERPRVDLALLEGRFAAWATRKLVPKVLVANQTRVLEAVADPDGAWLPGVPVTTVTPHDPHAVWAVAAVLTSPVASVVAWQLGAGTGLTTTSLRVGPALIGALPWPAGSLDGAIAALRAGDVEGCGRAVTAVYGVGDDPQLVSWWTARLPA